MNNQEQHCCAESQASTAGAVPLGHAGCQSLHFHVLSVMATMLHAMQDALLLPCPAPTSHLVSIDTMCDASPLLISSLFRALSVALHRAEQLQ
jgi:hypothetical protein